MAKHSVVLKTVVILAVFSCFTCSQNGSFFADSSELTAFQQDIMGVLTGYTEVSPGVQLANRYTIENKKAARDYLAALFIDMGYAAERHSYSENGENIYAVLNATVPGDEHIVLGAHYDTIRDCPGANDNASGVVTVITIAKELLKVKQRSKHVIFVLFDEEERGLVGSRFFAQKLKDDGIKVHSVHTIDQLAWDEDGDRAIELEIPYEGSVELYQQAVRQLEDSLQIHITQTRGSDHSSFRRLEFPSVGITEEYRNSDTTPHYHKATDTYETTNFDFLYSSTRLVGEVMSILLK
ncbi:M28 family metallopeptidase [candidate division KSB1 bacterium]